MLDGAVEFCEISLTRTVDGLEKLDEAALECRNLDSARAQIVNELVQELEDIGLDRKEPYVQLDEQLDAFLQLFRVLDGAQITGKAFQKTFLELELLPKLSVVLADGGDNAIRKTIFKILRAVELNQVVEIREETFSHTGDKAKTGAQRRREEATKVLQRFWKIRRRQQRVPSDMLILAREMGKLP